MPRLWVVEKEEVKSLILVCRARGYNSKQILSVVNDNLKKYNNSISEKAIFNILAKTKKNAQEWLKNLSVGKDDYIDEYRQRIMELNEQRRDLLEMVRNMKTNHLFKLQLTKRFILLQNLFCSYMKHFRSIK